MKIYQVFKGVFCAVCGSNREALEMDSAMMGTGIPNGHIDSGWRRWFTLAELPKVIAVLRSRPYGRGGGMSEPYKVTRSRGAWRLQTFFTWEGMYPAHPIDAVIRSGIHVEKLKSDDFYSSYFVSDEDIMKAVALIRLNGIPVEVVE